MGRPGLSLDKKFRRLAHDLDDFQAGFGRVLARGSLELLWDTAYESCTDEMGDAFDVEAASEWRGPAGRLVRALAEAGGPGNAGFIEEGGSPSWPEGKPGTYRIHDLWDHAPEYARKRAEREEQREEKGKTIKEMRAEAGRKGAAKTNAKRTANGRPASGNSPANVATLADQAAAPVSTPAGTPAPAPAPLSPPRAAPDPAEAKWPLVAAVLMALFDRGFECFWPADEKTAAKLEQAIRTVGITTATDRVMAVVEAERARKVEPRAYLGWYEDHIAGRKGQPARTHGDLGAELRPWPLKLTDEERRTARAELAALDPEFESAPLGVTGVPGAPYFDALCALNERWRAIAEARP
jgi:hypothetical protein